MIVVLGREKKKKLEKPLGQDLIAEFFMSERLYFLPNTIKLNSLTG